MRPIIPVILSGGSGTRLWPLSRLDRLKPLVSLGGGETLIRQTARRVADPGRFAPPMLVAGADDAEALAAEIVAAGAAQPLLIVEPAPRGTAAAIALAALAADSDALLLVLPSDHAIARPEAFLAAVETAREAAQADWLVTFGVAPDREETGFGYIRQGEPIGGGLHRAERFVEKPDLATAAALLAEGGHAWNAGIFLMRSGAYLAALAELAPDIFEAAQGALDGRRPEDGRLSPDPVRFAAAPSRSIDRAVMEHWSRVAVAPVDMGWSDVGSWEAVHALGPPDPQGNVVAGDVVAVDSSGCLIRSDGPVIAALGVSDLVIVATERAVLIVPRGESQRVKEAIDALEARRAPPPDEAKGGDR